MTDQPVTLEAHELIRGERARNYGPPHDNFAIIAELWDTYVTAYVVRAMRDAGMSPEDIAHMKGNGLIDGNDVCNLMSLLKVAREATGQGYHRDSTVDIIGYQAIKEALEETDRDSFIAQITS